MGISPVIQPVPRDSLKKELIEERLVRRFKGLEVYILDARETPAVMEEIGRIREIEFRHEGGGTGQSKDIDAFDIGEVPYKQLITWDNREEEIVSMYRYLPGSTALRKKGPEVLAMSKLFQFSKTFINDYLPRSVELGRSVVNRQAKKKLFGLFSVWAGLGALISEHKEIEYFSGKVTVSPAYPAAARHLIFDFWSCFFPGQQDLIRAHPSLRVNDGPINEIEFDRKVGFKANYAKLHETLKGYGVTVPSLMNSYITLTKRIQSFETARNPWFGDAFETAILVPLNYIIPKHRKQFIDNYQSINPAPFRDS